MALAALRKTLEPRIPRGIPSAYIRREGDAYALNLGTGGWVDIDAFQAALAAAARKQDPEEALNNTLEAVSLYRGDFLEEAPYETWCIQVRDRLREDYLRALRQILEYHEKRKNYAQSLKYADRYLLSDPDAEEIYQVVMRTHHAMGNRAGVARTYEKCRTRLETSLNCPVSGRTEALYRSYMSEQ